jgi:hypothetical protein
MCVCCDETHCNVTSLAGVGFLTYVGIPAQVAECHVGIDVAAKGAGELISPHVCAVLAACRASAHHRQELRDHGRSVSPLADSDGRERVGERTLLEW